MSQCGLAGVVVAAIEWSVVSQKLAPGTVKVVAHQVDEVQVPADTKQGNVLFVFFTCFCRFFLV